MILGLKPLMIETNLSGMQLCQTQFYRLQKYQQQRLIYVGVNYSPYFALLADS